MRISLLAVALFAAAPAVAADVQDQAQKDQAQEQTQSAAEPKERKICKRFASTESRMAAKRICRTAEQWKQMDREAL